MPKDFKNLTSPILTEDIEFILEKWEQFGLNRSFRGQSVLLTGGTGFFGKWITQALLAAEKRWPNGNTLTLVTRDAARARTNCPWFGPEVRFIQGDIRNFNSTEKYSTIIHGAAAASADLNENHPHEMFDSIVEGTRHVLRLATKPECRNFQFISSGGIYGAQPPALSHVGEAYLGAPDPLSPKSAYGEAKRAAEFLSATESRTKGFQLSVPRCFAFIGAYLPLDTHFAAGNFLLNVLKGEPIRITGDGATVRTYLYAADLVIWLMVIMMKGESGRAYNVGAEKEYSIAALAHAIHQSGQKVFPNSASGKFAVEIARKPDPNIMPARYVPDTSAARTLGLEAWTSLEIAAEKTLRWHAVT